MAIIINKTEFDLTVRKWGEKQHPIERDEYYRRSTREEVELEVKEELNFKTLSAIDVIRKVLDYLKDF
jgi:hypothetical protein